MTDTTERLNKHLALQLGVSRREADEMIAEGRVMLDGTPATLGARISPGTALLVDGKPIARDTAYIYLAFHKPVGYVCSRRAQGDTPTIYELLPSQYHHLKPVGRLDKDSSGLLLLSNDGDFAYEMTHPKFYKTKEYEVQLDHPLEPLHQQMISDHGVVLEDGPSKFTIAKLDADAEQQPSRSATSATEGKSVVQEALADETPSGGERSRKGDADKPTAYQIIMTEGRNRQIRRTFASLGYNVTKLHRTQFGPYALAELAPSEFRVFTP